MKPVNHRARIRLLWTFNLQAAWPLQRVCKVMAGCFWTMLSMLSQHTFLSCSPSHPLFFPETGKEARTWVRCKPGGALRTGCWTVRRVTELLGAQGPQVRHPLLPSARRSSSRLFLRVGLGCPLQMLTDFPCHPQWEKSQLDEGFMHSVENVCGCAKYECGEWGRADTGGRRVVNLRWVSWEGPGWVTGLPRTVSPPSPIQ